VCLWEISPPGDSRPATAPSFTAGKGVWLTVDASVTYAMRDHLVLNVRVFDEGGRRTAAGTWASCEPTP
jgi:hypothetical protein